MDYLGYDKIAVKGIMGLNHIERLELDIASNQHAKLKVTGLLNPESGIRYLEENLEGRTIQLVTRDGGEKTVFAGQVSVAHVTENHEVFEFETEAHSGTILLDQEKHSRSFQDINLTYPQVINQVIKDVPHCVANYQVGQDVKIGAPLIQYLEKDWDYLKRLASHFNSVVVPEVTTGQPRFWFGMPTGKNHTLTQAVDYKIGKDLDRFNAMGGKTAGYQIDDFLWCEVKTGAEFDIGDQVSFRKRNWIIGSKQGRMEKGLWVYTYRLGFASAMGLKKLHNTIISGMSLQGKVLETKGERIKVHLDIDKSQEKDTAYWYPWAPTSGNMMYCMPQVGTQVALYFPDEFESHARITGCVRTNGAECKDTGDPNNRYFTTEHNKQLAMLPGVLSLAAVGNERSPLKLSMLDDAASDFLGIKLESPKAIYLYAKGGIEFSSDKRIICEAKKSFDACQIKDDVLQSKLFMQYEFHVYATNEIIINTTSKPECFDSFKDGFDRNKFAFNVVCGLLAVAAIAALAVVVAPVLVGAAVVATASTFITGVALGAAVCVVYKAVTDYNKGDEGAWQDYVAKAICGGVCGGLGVMSIFKGAFTRGAVSAVAGKGAAHVFSSMFSGGKESYGLLDYAAEGIGGLGGTAITNAFVGIITRLGVNSFVTEPLKKITNVIFKTAQKTVAQNTRSVNKLLIQNAAKKFGKQCVETGGEKKFMYTLVKAVRAKNTKIIENFTPAKADQLHLADLQKELGKKIGINQAYQAVKARPEFLGKSLFEANSQTTKQLLPDSIGGVVGEQTSSFAGDKFKSKDNKAGSKSNTPYLVRGATLQCSKGNFKRKINLPEDNGVYITGSPVICVDDCISMQNIMDFRDCKNGKECVPDIKGEWRKVKDDFIINGHKVVTVDSFLCCKRGGKITVKNSGQKTD